MSRPDWALEVLACPACAGELSEAADQVRCAACGDVAHWDRDVLCFAVPPSASVDWYESVGGAKFLERIQIPFTMSSLDTPVYEKLLGELALPPGSLVIDAAGADGRNTLPFLAQGSTRVVTTDAIRGPLLALREHLAAEHPEWRSRSLLVQSDLRRMPLRPACADLVLAIEVLCYLNADYALGLSACRRVIRPGGRLFLSERSWEGALFTALLYGGPEALVALGEGRTVSDGYGDNRVESRSFTEAELLEQVRAAGLTVEAVRGVPLLGLVLGYLRGAGCLPDDAEEQLKDVRRLLRALCDGRARRTTVVVARA